MNGCFCKYHLKIPHSRTLANCVLPISNRAPASGQSFGLVAKPSFTLRDVYLGIGVIWGPRRVINLALVFARADISLDWTLATRCVGQCPVPFVVSIFPWRLGFCLPNTYTLSPSLCFERYIVQAVFDEGPGQTFLDQNCADIKFALIASRDDPAIRVTIKRSKPEQEKPMLKPAILALVRQVLTVAGTALVAKGYVEASDVEPVIGALLTIGSVVWSIGDKRAR
jgi:hypothetical protein